MARRRRNKKEEIQEEEIMDEEEFDEAEDLDEELEDLDEIDEDEDDEDEELEDTPAPPKKSSKKRRGKRRSNYQNLLDEFETTNDFTGIFFPKNGRTRFRIVAHPTDVDSDGYAKFFEETESYWQGQARTRYLVLTEILSTSNGEISDSFFNKQVPMLLGKSVMSQILALLAEGWDLIDYTLCDRAEGEDDPEEGVYGLSLRKTGQGLQTEYQISPSPKVLEVLDPDFQALTKTLTQCSEEYMEFNQSRQNSQVESDDEPEEEPTGKKRRSQQKSTGDDW